MTALKAGVALSSVRRPLAETKISRECAKSYTEKDSRVDDTVRIAKKQAEQTGKNKVFLTFAPPTTTGRASGRGGEECRGPLLSPP